jgi:hypothetical protein
MTKPTRPLFFLPSGGQKEQLNGGAMKLTPRSTKRTRSRGPRIAIAMDEITADLNYRGGEPRRAGVPVPVRQGRR